jgi:hypothetical protein
VRRTPRNRGPVGPRTNIYRQAGAWQVQIIRRGQSHGGWFADSVYAGRQPALIAARRRRDELLRQLAGDTRTRRRHRAGRRSSLPVGVSKERYRSGPRWYTRMVGHWTDVDGQPRKRGFSIRLYGRAGARQRALAASRQGREAAARELRRRQHAEAARRLREAPPAPPKVKDPRSRKGISMARRRRPVRRP